ncbi:hypothetical protein EYZ11_006169 [Aspergillus tanneri]|uniref:Uncharacterized protein n=1 Tax=Aspergillus tanneri TaxID=1220188 RepID=A0A4S3JM47_9EURO|nr:hypothetical protein EYZ11_006169 [Aspergillus tanneri]
MDLKAVFATLLLWAFSSAHPSKAPDASSIAAHHRVLKNCGPKVADMKARRALHRRDLSVDTNADETLYTIHAEAPKYDFIKNWTNILTPETSNGPYFYPRSQTLRQDIRENQPGVPLSLEIGVIDIDTCEALGDVLVDIWVSLLTRSSWTYMLKEREARPLIFMLDFQIFLYVLVETPLPIELFKQG